MSKNPPCLSHVRDVLPEQQGFYQAILEHISTYVWAVDADGVLVYCNAALLSFSGLTLEDLSAGAWKRVLFSDDRNWAITAWEEATNLGAAAVTQLRWRAADGAYHLLRCKMMPVKSEQNRIAYWVGTAEEIEQPNHLAQATQDQFAMLDDLSDPVLVWRLDGALLYFNRAAERLYGRRAIAGGAINPCDQMREFWDLPRKRKWAGLVQRRGRLGVTVTIDLKLQFVVTPEQAYIIETGRDISREIAAKEALLKRQEQAMLIANTAPAAICRFGADLRYLFVNPAHARRFHCEPHECLGRRVDEMLGEQCWETVRPLIERSLAGEPISGEARIPHPVLGDRYVNLACAPELRANGEVASVVVVISDITDAKKAEAMIRDAARRQATILQTLELLLAERDPKQIIHSVFPRIGTLLEAQTYFSYRVVPGSDELVLATYGGIAHESAKSIQYVKFGTGISGTVALTREPVLAFHIQQSSDRGLDLIRESGVTACVCMPLLIGETLLGTLAFASRTRSEFSPEEVEFLRLICGYITIAIDRSHAESSLRESEERFRLLAETAPVKIWMTNADGVFTYHNPQFQAFTGLSLTELTGTSLLRGMHPDDIRGYQAVYLSAFHNRCVFQADFRLLSNVGEYRLMESRGIPRFDNNGHFLGHIGTMIDKTEAAEAQAKIFRAKCEAEQANRAKDEFLAMLSHELRTPLTPLLLTASHLEANGAFPEQYREQIRMIRTNVELEARLIDDLLDVTRFAKGKYSLTQKPVDLHCTLLNAIETIRERIQAKGIHFTLKRRAQHTFSIADSTRLQQVFWNVLSNAVKFTPEGGFISVETQNPSPSVLEVTVTDTGAGISREMLSKIFNRFEQGAASQNAKYGGLGLGLFIAKTLLELHCGSIFAFSEGSEKGSRFTITLPLVSSPELAADGSQTLAKRATPVPLSILVVEDHAATRDIISNLLRRHGHTVMSAASCAEALSIAREYLYDALISDLGLPDGSGFDLLPALKEIRHEFTAIAISGYGTDADIQKSIAAGFQRHLTKPVSIEHLLTALADRQPGSRD